MVWLLSVAVCGGLLKPCRKIPVFPIYSELHCPLKWSRFLPCAHNQWGDTSRDELLAIFESLPNAAAKLSNSHSAHEINLFFTFTLFCALPRTMNLYDFHIQREPAPFSPPARITTLPPTSKSKLLGTVKPTYSHLVQPLLDKTWEGQIPLRDLFGLQGDPIK